MNTQPKLEDTYPNLLDDIKTLFEDTINEILESSRDIEDMEFERRDGFIPYSHNKGGIEKQGITDLYSFFATGYRTGSDKFNEKLEKYIDENLKEALEAFKDDHKADLKDIPDNSINYHDLYEMNKHDLAEMLSEYESNYLSDDYNTVMIDCRLMYHGHNEATIDVGLHATDAPYFRNKNCDDYLSIELKWTNKKDLKQQLEQSKEKLIDFIGSINLELN